MRACALLLLAACTAIGVHKQSKETWLEASNRSILTTPDVSEVTFNILRRRDLHDNYKNDPVAAITTCRRISARHAR